MKRILFLTAALLVSDSSSRALSQQSFENESDFVSVLDAQNKVIARRAQALAYQEATLAQREKQLSKLDSTSERESSILAIRVKIASNLLLVKPLKVAQNAVRYAEKYGFGGVLLSAGQDALRNTAINEVVDAVRKTDKSYYDLVIGDQKSLNNKKYVASLERAFIQESRERLRMDQIVLENEINEGKRAGFLPPNFQPGTPASAIPAARAMSKSRDARSRIEFADFGDGAMQDTPRNPNARLWREKGVASMGTWYAEPNPKCIHAWSSGNEIAGALDIAIALRTANRVCRLTAKNLNEFQRIGTATIVCSGATRATWGPQSFSMQHNLQAKFTSEREILVASTIVMAGPQNSEGVVYERCD